DLAGYRVLVVEDVEINRLIAREALRRMGCRVEIAEDGAQAVEKALAADYDIVLMDIQMPGTDGVEATRRIRAAEGPRSRVPIVAVTAHAMASEREAYLAAGLDDYLSKPFKPSALREIVARWTGEAREALPPEAPANAPAEAVDGARLRELAQAISPDVMHGLFATWLANTSESVERICTLAAARDASGIATEAHKLAGSAGNFGAARLELLARGIEETCRADPHADLREKATSIRRIHAETAEAIRLRLDVEDTPPLARVSALGD
ncbi:MAG: response regulator, partial [Stellaceae bacterium]